MRGARFLLTVVAALAAAGCMRHEPDDVAGRGLFNSWASAPQAYAQQPLQQPSVLQYGAGGRYAAAPASYAGASPYAQPYTLDAGDEEMSSQNFGKSILPPETIATSGPRP